MYPAAFNSPSCGSSIRLHLDARVGTVGRAVLRTAMETVSKAWGCLDKGYEENCSNGSRWRANGLVQCGFDFDLRVAGLSRDLFPGSIPHERKR